MTLLRNVARAIRNPLGLSYRLPESGDSLLVTTESLYQYLHGLVSGVRSSLPISLPIESVHLFMRILEVVVAPPKRLIGGGEQFVARFSDCPRDSTAVLPTCAGKAGARTAEDGQRRRAQCPAEI